MAPRYKVTLTQEERIYLEDLTHKGKIEAAKANRARSLLLCDAGEFGPAWKVARVSEAVGVSSRTIEHIKKRFVEEGLESALDRKKRKSAAPRKFDGAFEARLIALACSSAPDGYARWTLKLLADKIVELDLAPSVSCMTIHRILKKMNLSLI